jgi:uncharacterized membrane protein SpoIIM required for sporulation
MIESIISPSTAERKPWEMVAAGIIFTIVAAVITFVIDAFTVCSGAGYLLVSFITIAAAPLFVRVFCIEEQKRKGNLLERHMPVIEVYAYFFIGVIIATSFFYVLYENRGAQCVFSDQLNTLMNIGVLSTEKLPTCGLEGEGITGMAVANKSWEGFFFNNVTVLFLLFIFSFILGAGSIWLISWNASVIGVLIGYNLDPLVLIRILPHGILEFGGYFFGAVAGGILSAAIIQERLKDEWKRVLIDSFTYFGIAVVMILLGALVEAGI